jgi:hypothetical protein
MNFGQLKTEVRDLIARTDYTDAKAGTHVNRGMNRIIRVAELPLQEKAVTITLTDSNLMAVPDDFIAVKHMISNGIDLEKLSYTQLLLTEQAGDPKYYGRIRDAFEFRPTSAGTDVTLIYTKTMDELVNSTDSNELTGAAPEAIIYAAAHYAALYFNDRRAQMFEEKYQTLAAEVNEQHLNEELSTGAPMGVQPSFPQTDFYGGY